MPIPTEHKSRHIYHFTHLQNLPMILQCGLLSYNKRKQRQISHIPIALESIQERRAAMRVPTGPGGVVHDYVPFYFCFRSPMLLSVINTKNVDQPYLIYLGVSINVLNSSNVVFTSASANTNVPPTFYSDPSDLKKLDWAKIGSPKWGSTSDEGRHARMAEALVHRRLEASKIDHIIVWNEGVKERVDEFYSESDIEPPTIAFDGYNGRYFYYTKFYEGNEDLSTVTGPISLRSMYCEAMKEVNDTRNEIRIKEALDEAMFRSIEDAVAKLDDDFCALPELNSINNLFTENQEYRENIGAHTRIVVDKLRNSELYKDLSGRGKILVEFTAYLHDIGKGNSPRDNEGRQKVDLDHPARAIPLVKRILTEDIEVLNEKDIQQILLLVTYQDLIGDIVGKGRDRQQLVDVIKCAEDFDMLAALNCANIESFSPEGDLAGKLQNIKAALPGLREGLLKSLDEDE